MPSLDFTTLVLSFRDTAIALLDGEGDIPADLDAADVQIALLQVLADKTKGNLTQDEEGLLYAALVELQQAAREKRRL